MASGAVWMVLFKFTERGLGLVSTLILARLLVPNDFGLVAMATSLVAMLELLSAFGLDLALIRRPDAGRAEYDTAWTINVLTAVLVALIMLAAAQPVARWYAEPAVVPVISVLALGSVIQGLENIGVVAFRKEMRFDLEFRYQLVRKLAMFAVTVPLAFVLRSYWALVVGIVAGKAIGVAYSYYAHPYRPRFTLAARGELIGFSQWLLLNNIVMFLRDRVSDFIIGRLRGPAALGVYSLGYEIANMPTVELAMPINRAVYPGYARLHEQEGSLRQGFLAVIGLIALLAIPAGAGVSATAVPLTAVILGPKWAQAAPLIEILAFFGVIMALQTNSYSVFLAIGRPYLQSVVLGVYLAALLPLLVFMTRSLGLEGAAWACLASVTLMLPLNYTLVVRALDIEGRAIVRLLWRPLLAAAAMYAVVTSLLAALPQSPAFGNQLLRLIVAATSGATLYFAIVYLLWTMAGRPEGAERLVLQRLGRTKDNAQTGSPAKE